MRRLPGPAYSRLSDGDHSRGSLRIVSGLAANTNSIICDGSGEPETANGCPVLHRMRGPSAVRHSCATLNPDKPNARSPERAQRPCVFFLTLTYMEVGNPPTESGRHAVSHKKGLSVIRPDETNAFVNTGRLRGSKAPSSRFLANNRDCPFHV